MHFLAVGLKLVQNPQHVFDIYALLTVLIGANEKVTDLHKQGVLFDASRKPLKERRRRGILLRVNRSRTSCPDKNENHTSRLPLHCDMFLIESLQYTERIHSLHPLPLHCHCEVVPSKRPCGETSCVGFIFSRASSIIFMRLADSMTSVAAAVLSGMRVTVATHERLSL